MTVARLCRGDGNPKSQAPGKFQITDPKYLTAEIILWKLGFQPDSADELPACRLRGHRQACPPSETGKDACLPLNSLGFGASSNPESPIL